MLEVDSYIEALKATWVRREIKSNHSWTALFKETVSRDRFLWEMNGRSLNEFSKQISNPFWVEVLRSYASLCNGIKIEENNLSRYSLWFSDVTKHQTSCINAWRKKGLRYISDLINDEGQFLSFQQLKFLFQVSGSYLDYIGIMSSLPYEWKTLSRKTRAAFPVIHPQIEIILSKERGAKHLYDVLLGSKIKQAKNTWERGWELKYGDINWAETYGTIYQKYAVYYHILNYKIITQIVATNKLLYTMGVKDSPMCNRCNSGIETIEHKFWLCDEVNRFWADSVRYLNGLGIFPNRLIFTSKTIILGISESKVINRIISIGKSVIMKHVNLSVDLLLYKVKMEISNEKYMAQKRDEVTKFEEVWGKVDRALTET